MVKEVKMKWPLNSLKTGNAKVSNTMPIPWVRFNQPMPVSTQNQRYMIVDSDGSIKNHNTRALDNILFNEGIVSTIGNNG